ncbi:MAG: penicillin-binding transpeptidase domain-containing protein [Pseudomonadota bacterium]|nr:penicillin-binding transpeptidase domain-containing protein [Pseudomonadota bacterium]
MRKFIVTCLLLSTLTLPILADTRCFLAKEQNRVLKSEGDVNLRFSPASTFKIAISLMGFDAGVLVNSMTPEWPFDKINTSSYNPVCNQAQTPESWMKNSCVWYSQKITTQLGAEKFKNYVTHFDYGNQDITGDAGKNNGLTHSWLGSSLKISALEQATFVQKLIDDRLPVSKQSQSQTRKILSLETLPNGWKLYGKTGTNPHGSRDKVYQGGWFVGWIEKGERKIVFAHYFEDKQAESTPVGRRAKAVAKQILMALSI